ncbi:MAG: chorismate mutase [Pseudomonadota bacterium]
MSRLAQLREKINALDARLHDTLMARAACVSEIARIKNETGIPGASYQPDREWAIFQILRDRHHGELNPRDLLDLWRHLMAATKDLQTPPTVLTPPELMPLARAVLGRKTTLIASTLRWHSPADFIVLPWPWDEQRSKTSPWWCTLNPNDWRVCAALPAWQDHNEPPRALLARRTTADKTQQNPQDRQATDETPSPERYYLVRTKAEDPRARWRHEAHGLILTAKRDDRDDRDDTVLGSYIPPLRLALTT